MIKLDNLDELCEFYVEKNYGEDSRYHRLEHWDDSEGDIDPQMLMHYRINGTQCHEFVTTVELILFYINNR